ncbi:hypothetical protein TYRP_009999 [Tyrophagus putrescentiae]|nr:hypothetical protein TYRP_009999 [Tyrophagus putrescentiae]
MYLANEYDCERMQLKYYSPDMHRNFVLLRFVKKSTSMLPIEPMLKYINAFPGMPSSSLGIVNVSVSCRQNASI